jgi:ABC-type multidrug transport system fused ATPase/permease subunit
MLLNGPIGVAGWQNIIWAKLKHSQRTHAQSKIHQFIMNNDATFHNTITTVRISGAAELGSESLEILDDLLLKVIPSITLGIGSVKGILSSTGVPICMAAFLGIMLARFTSTLVTQNSDLLMESIGELEIHMEETRQSAIRGWRTIFHAGQTGNQVRVHDESLQALQGLYLWLTFSDMVHQGLDGIFRKVCSELAQYLVIRYLAGSRDPSSAAVFRAYVTILTDVVDQLLDIPQSLEHRLHSADRLRVIMQRTSEMKYGTDDLNVTEGQIELINVTFGYEEDKNIFQDLNVVFKPRKTTAIVGSSGTGKSTLLNMVSRLHDSKEEGFCLIDGQNVQSVKKDGSVLPETHVLRVSY